MIRGAPEYLNRGDPIPAEWLNSVVDAIVQRMTFAGGTVGRVGTSTLLSVRQTGGHGTGLFLAKITGYAKNLNVSATTPKDRSGEYYLAAYTWNKVAFDADTLSYSALPGSGTDDNKDYAYEVNAIAGLPVGLIVAAWRSRGVVRFENHMTFAAEIIACDRDSDVGYAKAYAPDGSIGSIEIPVWLGKEPWARVGDTVWVAPTSSNIFCGIVHQHIRGAGHWAPLVEPTGGITPNTSNTMAAVQDSPDEATYCEGNSS